jgi:hypothetical protein
VSELENGIVPDDTKVEVLTLAIGGATDVGNEVLEETEDVPSQIRDSVVDKSGDTVP